jgi:aspartate racemase
VADSKLGNAIEVIVPGEIDRAVVHDVIYGELVKGIVRDESRRSDLDINGRLVAQGAEGVIAGCTEVELLVTPADVEIPYFPTTRLHALAAVDAVLDHGAADESLGMPTLNRSEGGGR